MSLKRKVSELAAQKLPAKTGPGNSAGELSGLRPRPQFEQLVDYLAIGQERVQYPQRLALRMCVLAVRLGSPPASAFVDWSGCSQGPPRAGL